MPYLSAQEIAKAFQDGRKLQFNAKSNNGAEGGWVPFNGSAETLLATIAENRFDFRMVPRFEEGEFAYLVSCADLAAGRRYASSFRFSVGAMFVKVTRQNGYADDAHTGWTYDVVDSADRDAGRVHERDLRKADELLSQ